MAVKAASPRQSERNLFIVFLLGAARTDSPRAQKSNFNPPRAKPATGKGRRVQEPAPRIGHPLPASDSMQDQAANRTSSTAKVKPKHKLKTRADRDAHGLGWT